MPFVTEASQRAFRDAVEAIEAGSAVEVVVIVRARLRRWLGAHAAVGVAVAVATLAFTLFSDIEFALWEIQGIPVVAGGIGALAVDLLGPLQRALTPRRIRDDDLREAARAAFYDLRAHATRGRTGVLAFIAVQDRAAALIGDVGVVDAIGQPALDRIATTLAAAIGQGGEAVARALAASAHEFAAALPRAADDLDELPNLVHTLPPRARGQVAS